MPWIKPRCVAIETTDQWADDIQDEAGRIWELFIYDANVGTYLCEMTPSYALYCVDYISERRLNDKMDGDVRGELHTGDEPRYIHKYSVGCLMGMDLDTQRCKADEYDEVWESILEHYRANPPWIPEMRGIIEEWDGDENPPEYRQPDDLGWDMGDIEVEDVWFTGDDHRRFQHRVNLAAFYYGEPVGGETVTFNGGLFEVEWNAQGVLVAHALREPRLGRLSSEHQLQMEALTTK